MARLYLQHATLQLRLQTARLNPFKITTQTSSICKCCRRQQQQQQQGAQQLFALLRLPQLQFHTLLLLILLLQFHLNRLLLRPLLQFWGTLHGQKVLASSSFVGHATQHGKVRIGCIQQTLKHGQSHGVNVADSYLQAERNKPKREMKWSAYIKAGLESAK